MVFRQGETVDAGSIRRGADPVFRESDRMAYVGVSEFLINSAIMSVYSTGVMAQTEMVGIAKKHLPNHKMTWFTKLSHAAHHPRLLL